MAPARFFFGNIDVNSASREKEGSLEVDSHQVATNSSLSRSTPIYDTCLSSSLLNPALQPFHAEQFESGPGYSAWRSLLPCYIADVASSRRVVEEHHVLPISQRQETTRCEHLEPSTVGPVQH